MKRMVIAATLAATLGSGVFAQPYTYPEAYAPTVKQGGTVNEAIFGDFTTFNRVIAANATEASVLGNMMGSPGLTYRDWLGNRTFRKDDGSFNLAYAEKIEEVQPEQEFVVTLRKGWKWSDGTEMTADDWLTAWEITKDPDVQSNNYSATVVGEKEVPVEMEKIDDYSFRVTLPEPIVNALQNTAEIVGAVPTHIFKPAYDKGGAEAVRALWGINTDPTKIVSGGPYTIAAFRPGERLELVKNPYYGEMNKAADGTPLPGPDNWVISFAEDNNALVALVTTGQADFFYPSGLNDMQAIKQAVDNGTIKGTFYQDLGPGTNVDFLNYNFNHTDTCKREMFRSKEFRQAISSMIDRDALVQAAVGGLGYAATDWGGGEAAAPFSGATLPPFEFNPEQGRELLAAIGFSEEGQDGVLMNPDTGCRAAFTLTYNEGNNRRAQLAQVIAQTLSEYGVEVNARQVSTDIWGQSIDSGFKDPKDPSKGRVVNYDAIIWGLAGGDIDNPSAVNVFGIGQLLNAWNKSETDVEPWEISMDRLSRRMDRTLDLDERVAVYDERAEIMREYLPVTPLIQQQFSFYTDLGNTLPEDALDSKSIESPYVPGNSRDVLYKQ